MKRFYIYCVVCFLILSCNQIKETFFQHRYKIVTDSMLPAFYEGEVISPEISDTVIRRSSILVFLDPEKQREWIQRVMGVPGDTLLMKDKVLFVNGKNVDKELKLLHAFQVRAEKENLEEFIFTSINDNFHVVYVTEESYQKLELTVGQENIQPYTPSVKSSFLSEQNNEWTLTDFGPLVVQKGNYFLMGDNRENSVDSRMFGFVTSKSIVAKMRDQ